MEYVCGWSRNICGDIDTACRETELVKPVGFFSIFGLILLHVFHFRSKMENNEKKRCDEDVACSRNAQLVNPKAQQAAAQVVVLRG